METLLGSGVDGRNHRLGVPEGGVLSRRTRVLGPHQTGDQMTGQPLVGGSFDAIISPPTYLVNSFMPHGNPQSPSRPPKM